MVGWRGEALACDSGGGGEIRTHERITPSPVFKTGAFNRSATPPLASYYAIRLPPEQTENVFRERKAAGVALAYGALVQAGVIVTVQLDHGRGAGTVAVGVDEYR